MKIKTMILSVIFAIVTCSNQVMAWSAKCTCVNSNDETRGQVSVSCDWYQKITESVSQVNQACNNSGISGCGGNECHSPAAGNVLILCSPCV